MAVNEHDDAARHREDLLHRRIGAKRILGTPASGNTLVRDVGACSRTFSSRSSSPPRNSRVPGAPPGRKGVPCSIDGAARATGDGEACGFRGGTGPEGAEIRWKAIPPAMSTAAATPASSRQGAARR